MDYDMTYEDKYSIMKNYVKTTINEEFSNNNQGLWPATDSWSVDEKNK